MRRGVEAGRLAFSGRRDDAVAAFHEAVRSWEELDLPLNLALAQFSLVAVVGPETDDGAAARAAAVDILQKLGASSLAELMDGRLAGAAQGLQRP